MSKRLETKKKPLSIDRARAHAAEEERARSTQREKNEGDVFEKITITSKETLPYQNITMSQNRL
jgi:hypothetical protein